MDEEIERCAYKLDKEPRGIGLIIVNTFKGTDGKREGVESEMENLKTLFTNMGLEVDPHCYFDQTKAEMLHILRNTAKIVRLKTDSMIAIAISSNGTEYEICGNDNKPLEIHEIRRIFNGENCRSLAKKPKLFVLNSCRGENVEVVETIQSDGLSSLYPEPKPTTWSDFFTIHFCQFDTNKGSIFIQKLLEVYDEYWDYPFELIMPILNRTIINKFESRAKSSKEPPEKIIAQSCTWESSCTCILKIPPINPVQKLPLKPQSQPSPPPDDSFKLVWATCTKGIEGPNQMSTPGGVLTTPGPSGQIFITDSASKCIWVYSSDGEPMYQDIKPKEYIQLSIGNQALTFCWGMCIWKNFLFVSCTLALIKFSLNGEGVLTHKFLDAPISGMDVAESTIYACERYSCTILLFDLDLKMLPEKLVLTHTLNPTTDRLMDIKVLDNELYILVSKNKHTIQTFDKKGNHLRNLISREYLLECSFFTIHRTKKTIFAGDMITNELKAFNANGTLMYRTGCHGDKRGDIVEPAGIDLNDNGEVIIVSPNKTKFMLQCFQVPPNM